MRIFEARDLSKDWAGTPILGGVNLSVDTGEKIGLVGPNGAGKTSLLRIIAGLDGDFRGAALAAPGAKLALVPQRFEPEPGLTAAGILLAPARGLEARLEAAGEELARLGGAALERALAAYGELRAAYEALGAEEAPERAARLLERTGLAGAADREARLLSGGEKNVLALARAMMGEPDLLLLDEPGNHLDFGGLAWLEEFVRGERRAVIMVSHNRWLLDRAVDRIVEVEGGRATAYSGGYSAYRLEKLSRAAGQGRDWQADRKRVERLEALVARFAEIARARPDPAWGKRLRARRSQLEREKARAAERPDIERGRMSVAFSGEASKADFALVVRGYGKAFGGRVLLEDAEMDVLAGERVALVGPNGSGKTSFLRDLVASAGSLDGGPIRVGPSMRLGYCAQEQELFRPERSVAEEFAALGARDEETARLLRRFLFGREALEARIGSLSGGERNRLQIARAVWLKANFLVLDEPTNHLDIEGREAVEEGLADFEGAILVVSHDRWFLEKVAERIVLLEDRRFVAYEGSFGEYWRDLGAGAARAASGAARSRRGGGLEGRGTVVAAGRKAAEGGGKAAPGGAAEAAVRNLERRVGESEERKAGLEKASAEALARRDFARAGRLAAEAAAESRLLDKLYAEWAALT